MNSLLSKKTESGDICEVPRFLFSAGVIHIMLVVSQNIRADPLLPADVSSLDPELYKPALLFFIITDILSSV